MRRPPGPSPRLLVGDLDAEAELAALVDPAHRRAPLSPAALAAASGFATLLRAFARPGDRLWTPAPVDDRRLADLPGLPRPRLESGPLTEIPPAAAVLPWCETPSAAALRAPGPPPLPLPAGGPLWQRLWALPAPSPAVVAAVHHRAFALAVAGGEGLALPGARLVDSPGALADHLAAGGAAAAPGGRWVVKAPLSTSGRERLVASGRDLADPGLQRRLERLFAHHGELLFEPWMEREADFGACALLGDDGCELLGVHRLRVEDRGAFRGIELVLGSPSAPGLAAAEADLLAGAVEAAGAALARAGYRGPFGLDAYRHRTAGGHPTFHPLGELNARLTFGLVARALAERVAPALSLAPGGVLRFVLGTAPPPTASSLHPLLLPDPSRAPGAWLVTAATGEAA